jgi:hypothetical protein
LKWLGLAGREREREEEVEAGGEGKTASSAY